MIKIGTSGFSFRDWMGPVYPKGIKPAEALFYYEKELGFDCVEINSTYYTLVSAKSFEGMEKKTGPDFEFAVKGFRGITHDPFDPRLGDKRPPLNDAEANIDKFIYSLGPLKDKGKLGCVLLQFPVFFEPSEPSKQYLEQCKGKFGDIPLVVEFRNNSWAKPETFGFLRNNGLAYCAVDEPKLPRLMPFMNEVTSDTAYLRFHGRNRNWFNASLAERYDYLYSDEELEEFIPDIEQMEKSAKKTYVFFNNCHAGSAVKNAVALKKLLDIK
ncbi:MAG: DUF72 domain-containing protein [Endomicrobiales bacterium]|nr:DUF72 domain-containing protein [Endomicrobiales bacterium]